MKFISDEKLVKVSARENSEEFVSVKKFCPEIIVSVDPESRALQHLKKGECYVRIGVAKRLSSAQKSLPHGFHLMLWDGYRSIEAQRKMHDNFVRRLRKKHPEWSGRKILSFADLYIANPDKITLHSTGGAIDITICDSEGKKIDMGSEIDFFPENTDSKKIISSAAGKNRDLLKRCLEKQGFVNYPPEWWHWSYGDSYWAAALKKRNAIYSPVSDKKVFAARKK
jgi:D-alanyl-D-alanine dipeptidase